MDNLTRDEVVEMVHVSGRSQIVGGIWIWKDGIINVA